MCCCVVQSKLRNNTNTKPYDNNNNAIKHIHSTTVFAGTMLSGTVNAIQTTNRIFTFTCISYKQNRSKTVLYVAPAPHNNEHLRPKHFRPPSGHNLPLPPPPAPLGQRGVKTPGQSGRYHNTDTHNQADGHLGPAENTPRPLGYTRASINATQTHLAC